MSSFRTYNDSPESPDLVPGWLASAISDFGHTCQRTLDGPAGPEAAIRRPLETLLYDISDKFVSRLVLYPESAVDSLDIRPDYAVAADRAITGHIEVKSPATGIDPATFTGHNRNQWERLKDLPNLLYTNGRSWSLYRDGVRVGDVVHLDGDLKTAGRRLLVHDGRFEILLRDFLTWQPVPIRSPRQLISTLASLCRLIRFEVLDQLAHEEFSGAAQPFTGLANDWRTLLFPEAKDDQFADGYAQTIVFALLLARSKDIELVGRSMHDIGDDLGHDHSLMGAAFQLLTNQLSDGFKNSIQLVVRVVAAVEWHLVWRDHPDPYLHLYEDFLEAYDKKLRRASGSYYTPAEVVTEMVRMVDDLLRTRLGHAQGFRSPEVAVLDPAMGTGTFLHAIIQRVADQAAEHDGPGAVSRAVIDLTSRLVGFEMQMGPFAVAEMRAAEMVAKYHGSIPRDGLNLCLTNTLDDPYAAANPIISAFTPLSMSRIRACQLKRDEPVEVVIGNPPYAERAHQKGRWVERGSDGHLAPLLQYQLADNRRAQYVLKNQYIYFWAFATWKLYLLHHDHRDGDHRHGILAFISAAGYLRGPGFKGMREYLRRTCDEGWIIDLSPEGMRPDPSTRVFPGVQQPLAIALFVRRKATDPARLGPTRPAPVRYIALHGPRQKKFVQLRELTIDGPGWVAVRDDWQAPFTPVAESDWDEYPALGDLMPWTVPGVKPNRAWVYAPSPDILRERWEALVEAGSRELREALFKKSNDRTIDAKVDALPGGHEHSGTIAEERGACPRPVRIAYRSFDRQWIIPDNRLLDRSRPELWRAAGPAQIFLNEQHAKPLTSGPGIVLTTLIPDMDHYKGSEGGRVLPMRHAAGLPNAAPRLLDLLSRRLGHPTSIEDLVGYLAGVLGHRGFIGRFAKELVTPGIRVPITADPALWTEAVTLGREVAWVHTYGEAFSDSGAGRRAGNIRYPDGDSRYPLCAADVDTGRLPETIHYEPSTETLHIGAGAFAPVPAAVWEYGIEGVPVVRKWFSYRKANPGGRVSSRLDAQHTERWHAAWDIELNDLLTLLRRLVELEPAQDDLLDRILAGPLITVAELTAAGVFPVPDVARRAHRQTHDDLFSPIPQPDPPRSRDRA